MNEIILNKKISIERCISQIRAYYAMASDTPFESDYLKQDAIAMNLQRIAELAIDVANHLIKSKKLGLPQDSADAFVLLNRANLISVDMMKSMKGMVGFRNVLAHEYQRMDLSIMKDVIERHLCEPLDFADMALKAMN
ncbi:MAG: DUF86 domain-containing protein [Deltaproteobacteria bacterium]|nr:DUF86 domain-containing protein [Deltaproteobacteria bacterium]